MFLGINSTTAQKSDTSKDSEITVNERIENSLNAWSDRLQLTAEQQIAVKPLITKYITHLSAVRSSTELTHGEKKAKTANLRKKIEEEMSKHLTDEQASVFKRHRKTTPRTKK